MTERLRGSPQPGRSTRRTRCAARSADGGSGVSLKASESKSAVEGTTVTLSSSVPPPDPPPARAAPGPEHGGTGCEGRKGGSPGAESTPRLTARPSVRPSTDVRSWLVSLRCKRAPIDSLPARARSAEAAREEPAPAAGAGAGVVAGVDTTTVLPPTADPTACAPEPALVLPGRAGGMGRPPATEPVPGLLPWLGTTSIGTTAPVLGVTTSATEV